MHKKRERLTLDEVIEKLLHYYFVTLSLCYFVTFKLFIQQKHRWLFVNIRMVPFPVSDSLCFDDF